MKRAFFAFTLAMFAVGNAFACSIDFVVNLETFGEGVTVELRHGTPGSSRLVRTQRSNGGAVYFKQLCPGSYFIAIGNGDNVSVAPVRQFEDDMKYTSTIRTQRGSGNVSKKSRSAL